MVCLFSFRRWSESCSNTRPDSCVRSFGPSSSIERAKRRRMAVASDAIYGTRMVASYVSSSAYYGYVPLCRRESEPMISGLECGALPGESSGHSRYAYDSPMDTDDDGHDCSTASRRLNNHCLIPEESLRHRWQSGEGQHPPRQQQQQAVPDAEAFLRRRNRKRCNADFGPAAHCKKLREEVVVTAAFTMVQEVQRRMDWPRCVMNQHPYT